MAPVWKFPPSPASQLGLPMHSQSANHGKLKLSSLTLEPFLLLNPIQTAFPKHLIKWESIFLVDKLLEVQITEMSEVFIRPCGGAAVAQNRRDTKLGFGQSEVWSILTNETVFFFLRSATQFETKSLHVRFKTSEMAFSAQAWPRTGSKNKASHAPEMLKQQRGLLCKITQILLQLNSKFVFVLPITVEKWFLNRFS